METIQKYLPMPLIGDDSQSIAYEHLAASVLNPKKEAAKRYYEANKFKWRKYSSDYRKRNPEKVKEVLSKWRIKNKKQILKNTAEYRNKNRSILNSNALKKYWNNRDVEIAKTKAWRKLNPDKVRAQHRRWREKNPGKANARSARRRTLKNRSTVQNLQSISDWIDVWRKKKFSVCFWCKIKTLSKNCHSDHIIALSKGGKHSVENLAISCATCNLKKGSKDISEWNNQIKNPVLF